MNNKSEFHCCVYLFIQYTWPHQSGERIASVTHLLSLRLPQRSNPLGLCLGKGGGDHRSILCHHLSRFTFSFWLWDARSLRVDLNITSNFKRSSIIHPLSGRESLKFFHHFYSFPLDDASSLSHALVFPKILMM